MGCGLSTMDNSEIVKLCRERKDLIKAAKDCRYALASSHNSYFQSLLDVGNSLHKLVEEEVMTSVEPPSSTHSDHQSNGDGSHLEISSLESDTDISSLTDYVHEGSEFSEQSPEEDEIQEGVNSNIYQTQKSSEEVSTGVYEQPQVVDATAQWHNPSNLMAQYPQYGNGVFSGCPTNFMPNNPRFLQYGNGGFFGGLMNLPPLNPMFSQYGNGVSFGGLKNFPHPNLKLSHDRNEVPFGGPMNFPPNNLDFPPNGDGVSFDTPMNLPPADLRFPRYRNVNFPDNNLRSDHHGMEANFPSFAFSYPQYGNGVPYGGSIYFLPNDPRYNLRQSRNAPENLPPPEVSSWDYLNPFSVIDDNFSRYYFEGRYETGFGSIGPDLREVREKEGIPDLEVEAEKEEEDPVEKQPKETETEVKNKGDTVEGRCETVQLKGDSGEGSFEAVPLKEDSSKGPSESAPLKNGEDDLLARDKEITRSPGVPEAQEKDHEFIEKDTEGNSEKSNCLEEEENGSSENVKVQDELEQEGVCPVQVSSTTINTYESRDLKEVLKDIKDACETAFDHGKELSVALEMGKLQYQPRSAIVKVLSSWFLSFVAVKRVKAKNGSLEKDECMNTANLSSILEQLSIWEKKLYKEVKDEERLRGIYAKEQKKLKKLDDRGVESSKIDATYNSIEKLLLKIKVAVSTVDAISKRINKLRDEELRPRLNELILSLTGMWTFMVDCHQKQFLAMLEGKTQLQIAQAAIERNSSIMAVRKLETDILNWATAFTYWISTQKSFVKFLNGCLMKCLLKEPEETPDGIAPFSPTRLGAPPIFITCNDWYNAIENVSGAGVSKAMHEFASMLNQLGKKLDEEKRQRLKVEYLAKDLEKRVKTLYEESGMNWEQYVLSNNAAAAEVTTESGILIPDGLHVDLKPMKNRLDDERARRTEAIMQANDIASQGFRAGLVRVFEALDGFSGEMLKALEQVRFPKGEGGTE